MKSIYKLDLHESTEIKSQGATYIVTRVASGWIYSIYRLDSNQMTSTFIPFDNKFQ